MKNENPKCPICETDLVLTFDSWGKTPYHAHCHKCQINIGGPSPKKVVQEFLDFGEFLKKQTQTGIYEYDIRFLEVIRRKNNANE